MNLTLCSDLFRDFFAHADSIAAGVPANDVVKKRSLSDTKVGKPPTLMIEVSLTGEQASIQNGSRGARLAQGRVRYHTTTTQRVG